MKDFLEEIRPVAAIYVDILSRILKVHVTIVDANMHRIAVSNKGHYQREVDNRTDITQQAGILMRTIRDGKTYIVENPRTSELCAGCTNKERCMEKYHMSTPIFAAGQVKGALAFTAMTNQQSTRIKKNHELYSDFLKQFSELVSLKMQETIEKQANLSEIALLNEIVEHLNAGVLIFDNENQLVQINELGRQLLSYEDPLPVRTRFSKPDDSEGYAEYQLWLPSQSYRLVGRFYPIHAEAYSNIFIFSNGVRSADGRDKKNTGRRRGIGRITGESSQSMRLRNEILTFANSASPALILGETGTEKRDTALALHEESSRCEQPFVILNCRGLTGEALEGELFGVVAKGSKRGVPGKLETANRGTVVLENIESLNLQTQIKLKQVLYEGTYMRVGGSKTARTGARIVATTTADIELFVKKGHFLLELYYKLRVISILITPLRQRSTDIRQLAEHFLKNAEKKACKSVINTTTEFWHAVSLCTWEGNLWQLESAMEYAVNRMGLDGLVKDSMLPEDIQIQLKGHHKSKLKTEHIFNLKELERTTIADALTTFGADSQARQQAADALGIGIATLYRKIKQYGL